MKDPKTVLENIYENYQLRQQSGYRFSKTDKLRWLGGMEILLRCVVGLEGVAILYQKRERKFLFFKFGTEESYEDYVLRHADDYLRNSQ